MLKSLCLVPFLALALRPADVPPNPPVGAARHLDTEHYDVDGVHSQVTFKVRHLGVSNNYGRFNEISGSYNYDEKDAGKCSVDIEVKAGSVDTNNKKRDDHLTGTDFLKAKQFPTITFKSKAVKATGKDTLEVTGDFTLCGVTKSITVMAHHIGAGKAMGGFRRGFELDFTIKRSEYGIKTMPDGIGEDVHLMLNIEGVRADAKK